MRIPSYAKEFTPKKSFIAQFIVFFMHLSLIFALELDLARDLGRDEGSGLDLPIYSQYKAGKFYFFHENRASLLSYSLDGTLSDVIFLKNLPKSVRPVSQFLLLPLGRLWILGADATVILYDLSTDSFQEIASSLSSKDSFFEIQKIDCYEKFIHMNDRVSASLRIYSARGKFLGSFPMNSGDFLSAGANEVLSLREDKDREETVIERIAHGRKSTFFRQRKKDGDEFVSLFLIGRDQLKNLYVQKNSGSLHGKPKIFILKLSPTGRLLAQKEAEVSDFEFQEMGRLFQISDQGVFQIRLLHKDGLKISFRPVLFDE